MSSTLWTRLSAALMLGRRETRLLLLTAGVDSFGTGVYSATSMLFFTQVRHFSFAAVGVGISAGSICALLFSTRLGRLADRYGPRPTLIAVFVARAVGYTLYLLAQPYWAFLVLSCLVTTVDRASSPINQSLMGNLFGQKDRATILGTVFSVRNGAIVLGSLAATVPVMFNSPALYGVCVAVNAGTFLVAAAVLARMPAGTAKAETGPAAAGTTEPAAVRSPLRSGPYLLITAVNAVLLLHNTLLTVVLPLWVTEHTEAPRWALTALLALNGVLAMSCQVPVNRRFSSYHAAGRASAFAGVAVLAACVAYAASGAAASALPALVLLVVAMLAHTAGECLHIASTPLSFSLAPPQARGRYLTFYNLGRVGQDLAGPVLLGSALLGSGAPVWWLVGAAVAVAGALPWLLLRGPEPVWDDRVEPGPKEPDRANR
ncbi:MFS transporter [Streptomyces anandii]|uniref:MFS transporter n=1 Tax=Streptomyces anandii TaxID=285454 RepID=UPI0036A6DE75